MRTTMLGKIVLIVALWFFSSGHDLLAIGQAQYVVSSYAPGSFPIIQGNHAATILVDPLDWPGVNRAVNDLQADIARVTGGNGATSAACRSRPSANAAAAPGSITILTTSAARAITNGSTPTRSRRSGSS